MPVEFLAPIGTWDATGFSGETGRGAAALDRGSGEASRGSIQALDTSGVRLVSRVRNLFPVMAP